MTSAENLSQQLETGKCFSKINIEKGFRQTPVAEADIEKTTLITLDGPSDFLRMLFELRNSGAMFI